MQGSETFPATNCHTLGSGLRPSWENRKGEGGQGKLDGKAMAKSRAAIPCGILVAIAKQFMQCLLAEHELQHWDFQFDSMFEQLLKIGQNANAKR